MGVDASPPRAALPRQETIMIRLDSARSALFFSLAISLTAACGGSAGIPGAPDTHDEEGTSHAPDAPDTHEAPGTEDAQDVPDKPAAQADVSTLRGTVTDLGAGDLGLGLGGQGTVAATSTVRI